MTYSIGSAGAAVRTVSARRPSGPDGPAAVTGRSSPLRSWSTGSDGGTPATASTATAATAPTATITQATTAQPQKQPTLKEIVSGLLRTLDTEAIPNCGFQRPHRSMSTVHRLVDAIATSRIASVTVHLPDFLVDAADADPQAAAGSVPMSEARVSTALNALGDPHSGASADKGCGTHTKTSLLDALSLVARASIKRDLRAAEAARMTREALLIAYANRPTHPAAAVAASASAAPSTSTAAALGVPPSAPGRSGGDAASWMPSRSLKRTRSNDGGSPVRFPRIGSPHSVDASQARPAPTVDRSTPGRRPTSPESDSRSTSPDMPAWTIPRHHPAPARFARSIDLPVEEPRPDEVGLDRDQTQVRQLLEANGGCVPDGFRLDFPLAIDSTDARHAKRKNNTAAIGKMFTGSRRSALAALSAINDMFHEIRPVFTTPSAVRKAAKADAQPGLATHAASIGDRNTTAGVADERYATPFRPSPNLAVLADGAPVVQRRSQTFPPAALDMLHEHGIDPDKGFTFTIPRHVYNDGPESDVRRTNTHALLKSRDGEKSDSQVASALGRLNAQFENAPFVAHLAFERRRHRLFERSSSDSTS